MSAPPRLVTDTVSDLHTVQPTTASPRMLNKVIWNGVAWCYLETGSLGLGRSAFEIVSCLERTILHRENSSFQGTFARGSFACHDNVLKTLSGSLKPQRTFASNGFHLGTFSFHRRSWMQNLRHALQRLVIRPVTRQPIGIECRLHESIFFKVLYLDGWLGLPATESGGARTSSPKTHSVVCHSVRSHSSRRLESGSNSSTTVARSKSIHMVERSPSGRTIMLRTNGSQCKTPAAWISCSPSSNSAMRASVALDQERFSRPGTYSRRSALGGLASDRKRSRYGRHSAGSIGSMDP